MGTYLDISSYGKLIPTHPSVYILLQYIGDSNKTGKAQDNTTASNICVSGVLSLVKMLYAHFCHIKSSYNQNLSCFIKKFFEGYLSY